MLIFLLCSGRRISPATQTAVELVGSWWLDYETLFSGQLLRLLGSLQIFWVAFLKVTKGIFCLNRIDDCVKAKYELEVMTWKSVPDFEAVFYLLVG